MWKISNPLFKAGLLTSTDNFRTHGLNSCITRLSCIQTMHPFNGYFEIWSFRKFPLFCTQSGGIWSQNAVEVRQYNWKMFHHDIEDILDFSCKVEKSCATTTLSLLPARALKYYITMWGNEQRCNVPINYDLTRSFSQDSAFISFLK